MIDNRPATTRTVVTGFKAGCSVQAYVVKLRKSSILFAILLSTFAPTSSFAQSVVRTASNETAAVRGTEESERQSQAQQSDQAELSSPSEQPDDEKSSVAQTGIIIGTVTDVNDTPVPSATVTLQGQDPNDVRSVTTNENGFFEIRDVEPGRPYQVRIHAAGFSEWQSPVVALDPGQSKILDVSKLQIEEVQTNVTVTPESSQEIAIQQVKAEEKQRGFAIIPNFYAAYDSNPAPMSAGLKFRLALRVTWDPFTLAGTGMLAGIGQATDSPDYVQGAKGFGERFGANYANSVTDIMLDGAILPSLLHQDPRYFYKGTGTTQARAAHVLSSLFVARGDNGNLQPNYSGVGGDLASSAISNLYYPRANRGAGLVLQGFATITAIHLAVRMLDEFVFRPAKGSVTN